MTILCAALGDGYAVVGGDGRATNSGHITYDDRKKWLVHPEGFAVGACGSERFAMHLADILEDHWNAPDFFIERPQALFDYLKERLVEDGWRWKEDVGSQYADGRVLFVTRDAIWSVESDLTALCTSHRYWAIGSGEDYALGAMYNAAHSFKCASPVGLVHYGIDAARTFHSACGGELQIAEVR